MKRFPLVRALVPALLACLSLTLRGQSTSVELDYLLKREATEDVFPSPSEWSFYKYVENPVGLYNGSIDVSLPLFTLVDGAVSLPVTLRYNTSGIRVDEEASWVGLGWNLSLGGCLTRVVIDGDDYAVGDGFGSFKDYCYGDGVGYSRLEVATTGQPGRPSAPSTTRGGRTCPGATTPTTR